MFAHFNSSMVRLKVDKNRFVNWASPLFQFLYGAIKRVQSKHLVRISTQFQFVYGAIKSKELRRFQTWRGDFNSSMVRLKAGLTFEAQRESAQFQFLYGAIKSFIIVTVYYDYLYFNSSMVRLKVSTIQY